MPDNPLIYQRFSKALAEIGAVRKAQTNQHHGYQFRGIDDILNRLHEILAANELFYVPRLVSDEYEQWQTSRGARLQVARVRYEYEFYAPDGSSIVVGPVVGQSADTDDKAPMQASSQAAKVALIHAFCIPTDDLQDGDANSPLSADGGRAGNPTPDYVVNGQAGPNADVTQVLTMLDGLPPDKRAEAEQILNSQLPQWRQGIPADKRDGVFGWLNDLFNQARAAS